MLSFRKLCSSSLKDVTCISKRQMKIKSKVPIGSTKKAPSKDASEKKIIDELALILSGESKKSPLLVATLVSMPLAYIVGTVMAKKQTAQVLAHHKIEWSFRQDSSETKYLERLRPIIEQVLIDTKRDNAIQDINDLNIFFTDHLSVYPLLLGSSVDTTVGCAVGVPFYSIFSSKDEVNLDLLKHKSMFPPIEGMNIIVNLEQMKIPPDQIDKIKDTFTLSDKAKKFMIASYLAESQSKVVSLSKIAKYAIALGFVASLQVRMKSFAMKRHLPPGVFVGLSMMTIAAGGLFSFVVALTCRQILDVSCDHYACSLGTEYAEGGVEFYSKAIERLQFLREYSKGAANAFTEEGDINCSNDIQDAPISSKLKDRLEFCQNFEPAMGEPLFVSLIKS